jgi:acetoacetyl-CoA reductase
MSRVALVTGGTRGIGAGICEALKGAGYIVAANYGGNDEAAMAFSERMGIYTYKFDVGSEAEVQFGVHKISGDLGPIEILVNNAGITRDGFLHKTDPRQWNAVIQTNLTACFYLCRAVIEVMRVREFGRIVNIGSVNGQVGQVGQSNYSAAKAGVIGFTKALAREAAAKGITVNAITPGYINTDKVRAVPGEVLAKMIGAIPRGRLGEVEDIARAVLFLVADEADWITGSTLSINGGQHML